MSFSLDAFFSCISDLRGEKGCPWNQERSLTSICHHLIEEAHEVIDADQIGDAKEFKEEMGDLLFNTFYVLFLACEKYDLNPSEVAKGAIEKVKRRHPHVFENPRKITLDELKVLWEEIKRSERELKGKPPAGSVVKSLPPTKKAMKLYELMTLHNFKPKFDETNLGDQIIQSIFTGLDQYQNMEEVLTERLKKLEEQFLENVDKKSRR